MIGKGYGRRPLTVTPLHDDVASFAPHFIESMMPMDAANLRAG